MSEFPDRLDIVCLLFLVLIAGAFSMMPMFFQMPLIGTAFPLSIIACLFPLYVKHIKQKGVKHHE